MDSKAAATKVLKTIHKNGYLALFAGGCVRDMLLEREPKDYDIATNAHPEVIIGMFKRTIEVGAQFGVVIVMVKEEQIEVATFRTESGYVDGRRPGKVEFADAKEDAIRRDFTINGMFYDPINDEVIDYVGGREDLAKKLIKTIGDPYERFSEDYLRMLRAVRFAAQLDFEIDTDTWNAVCKHAHKISDISGERIAVELESALRCDNRVRAARLFVDSGLANIIFAGVDTDVFESGIKVLSCIEGEVNLPLALAALFASCGGAGAIDACEVLKLSNKNVKSIYWLLNNINTLTRKDISLAEFKKLLANEDFWRLAELQKAICVANNLNADFYDDVVTRAKSLDGVDLQPKPLLNGHDIMKLGVKAGPKIGEIANELYTQQLNEVVATKKQAKEWVKNQIEE